MPQNLILCTDDSLSVFSYYQCALSALEIHQTAHKSQTLNGGSGRQPPVPKNHRNE
jgi:hypothetical protein